MKFQLSILVAILCFQCSAYSMFNHHCSPVTRLVSSQLNDGTSIPESNYFGKKIKINNKANDGADDLVITKNPTGIIYYSHQLFLNETEVWTGKSTSLQQNNYNLQGYLDPKAGSNEEGILLQVDAYSSPSKDQVYIKLKLELNKTIRLDIIDLSGKVYKSLQHRANKGIQVINTEINDLPPGIYTLNVYAGAESQSFKFVKH